MADEKKVITNEVEETEEKEISVENLDEVAGGGALSNIPRVPTKKIDDKFEKKLLHTIKNVGYVIKSEP